MITTLIVIAFALGIVWLLVVSASFRKAFAILFGLVAAAIAIIGGVAWYNNVQERNRKIVVACQEHIGHPEVMRHPMVWEIEHRPGFWYMEFNDDFGVICNSEDPQNFDIVKYDKRPEKFDVSQCDNRFYRLEWAEACARHGKP